MQNRYSGSDFAFFGGVNRCCFSDFAFLTYKILYTMVKSPHRVYSRNQLITYALEDAFDGYDRTIDSYIKSIRKKIEKNPRRPRYIITVHGVGYKYVPSDSEGTHGE